MKKNKSSVRGIENEKKQDRLRKRKSITSNMSSEGEQSSDLQLLRLHELDLTLFSFVELLLELGTLRFESSLQLSHSIYGSIAVN